MSHRRVVVTGMGAVTPLGNDLASTWEGVVNGRSGIGPVTHFDTTGFTTRIAGQIRDFDPTTFVPPKDAKKMEPFIHYGLAASFMALDDSGLEITEANADRIGAIIGSGIGGILGIEEQTAKFLEGGARGATRRSTSSTPWGATATATRISATRVCPASWPTALSLRSARTAR